MEGRADFRSFSPGAQEAIRMRAVAAVKAGMGKTKGAEVFGVAVVRCRAGCVSIEKVARRL